MRERAGWIGVFLMFAAAVSTAQSNTFPSTGNVGIGTTSPSAPLQIEAGDDSAAGQINCGAESATCPASSASGYGLSLDSDYSTGQYRWRWEPIDRGYNISLYLQEAQGTANSYSNVVRFGWNQFDPSNAFAVFGNTYVSGNVGVGTSNPDGKLNIAGAPNSWTSNGWAKGIRLDGIHAIEFGGGATTKYGMGQSGNNLYLFDTTADDNSSGANYRMVLSAGNLGIGTTTPGQRLEVNGSIKLTGGSGGSVTYADGTTQSTAWTGSLCGGDYAESVDVTGDRHRYGPGDVLQIDDDNPSHFMKVAEAYSTAVAGVFSTRPGALGRRQSTPKTPDEVPLAMIGIVPVKVTTENGPIRPHDLLVSSSVPGYAMRGTDRNKLVGAVIGKAMGSLDKGTGVIEVLVTLQ